MAVKYVLLAILCATYVILCQSCHNGKITWVKLNTSPLCFGARDNKYGAFTPGMDAFVWAFMIKHRSGYVSCNTRRGNSRIAWGYDPNHGHIFTFLTDERNVVVGPCFSQPVSQLRVNYVLPGYHSSSPFLIFFMGRGAYGVHHMAELRLWYGEDLFDYTEFDDGGRSCADVYGLMYKD